MPTVAVQAAFERILPYTEDMALNNVSVVLLEPLSVFEFAVAVEVFGIDRTPDGVPPVDFRVCAVQPGVPLSTKHTSPFSITASHGLEGVVGSDLVIVSATDIREADEYPVAVLDSLRSAYDAGARLLSLCSGSFVLGAAGLLDGRSCTTHWMHAAELAEAAADRLASLARGDRATWWSRLAGRVHLSLKRRSQARPAQVEPVPDAGRCLARP